MIRGKKKKVKKKKEAEYSISHKNYTNSNFRVYKQEFRQLLSMTTTTDLSSYNREHKFHKDKIIYYLDL